MPTCRAKVCSAISCPLIEGTSVSTKHGTVKTDHILFIASGAFHVSKPSDLLPELQGRLPIRVELNPLTIDDFRRILTETEASLIKQSVALLATEGIELVFTDDSIEALAKVAVDVNSSVENIGARRLQTVLERVLDEISFTASDRSGDRFVVDGPYVRGRWRALPRTPTSADSFSEQSYAGWPRSLKLEPWVYVSLYAFALSRFQAPREPRG